MVAKAKTTKAQAEAALEEALAERNRLWDELQHDRADQRELDYLRAHVAGIEASVWWRLGAPLRLLQRAIADPKAALIALWHLLHKLRKP